MSPIPVGASSYHPMSYCHSVDLSLAYDKIESFINWSIATYKTTREIIQEKLGKVKKRQSCERNFFFAMCTVVIF